METTEIHLRKKHLTLGKKCDYDNSRAAAIRLFCLSCMGGESEASTLVRGCTSYTCPLWQFRMGSGTQKLPKNAGIPTLEEYNNLIEKSTSPEKREWGKKLGELRKNK